jgi:flagellar M-ring protein FliF
MDFKTLISQLTQLFIKLNKQQQIVLVSSVVVVVAFLIFLVIFQNGENGDKAYKSLFQQLSASDAAAIIEELEASNVPYKLGKNNRIDVPKEYVYKERIRMASLGYPSNSGVGFELFDTQEFGATKFDQNVKFLRALEGELSRTVEGLNLIEKAKVHIALPKDSLFVTDKIKPTASIAISIKPNMKLSSRQIMGIKHLIASSVPELTPANVMLISSDGEALGNDDELNQSTEEAKVQMKYQRKMEKFYEDKIINVLSPFIGSKERVVAKVSIEFDFSKKEQTKEFYEPDGVIRSEQTLEEKREGFVPKEIGGVPGAVSNIGPVQGISSNKNNEKYSKNKGTTNYEISKTTSSIKGQFATIKRITAAVVVDGKYKNKKDKDGNELEDLEYQALDETQIAAIINLVKQSIGILNSRGDEVSVTNFAFQSTKDSLDADKNTNAVIAKIMIILGPFSPIFKYLFAIIVLIVFYKKVIVPFSVRMLEMTKEEEEEKKAHIVFDEEEEENLAIKMQDMRKKVEGQLGFNKDFNEEEMKYEVLLEKLEAMVDEKPSDIAAILNLLIENEIITEINK